MAIIDVKKQQDILVIGKNSDFVKFTTAWSPRLITRSCIKTQSKLVKKVLKAFDDSSKTSYHFAQ